MGLLDRFFRKELENVEIVEFSKVDEERVANVVPIPELLDPMPDLQTLGQQFLATMERVGDEYLPTNQELSDYIAVALRDPDIETQLSNFYALVRSSRLEIKEANDTPEAKRAAEVVNDIITEDIRKEFIDKSIRCVEQGFSVLWTQLKTGFKYPFVIQEFTEPRYTYFDFDVDGNLIDEANLTVYNQPNWVVTTYREKWGDRHGLSILLSLYWTLKFQKLAYKEIVVLLDKLGVPSFAALLEPSGNDQDDKKRANAIAGVLKTVKSHSGIALTAKDIVKLEAQGGAATEILDFIRFLDDKKTTTIMGTLLATGTATNSGTYNLAENHADITNQRAEDVADLLAKSMSQQIVPLLVKLNIGVDFSPENYPEIKFIFDRNASLDELLKVGEKVTGATIKAETLKKTYNIPIENDDDEILTFGGNSQELPIANFSTAADQFFFQKLLKNKQNQQMKNMPENQTS